MEETLSNELMDVLSLFLHYGFGRLFSSWSVPAFTCRRQLSDICHLPGLARQADSS